jgi:hypothetical protein
MAGAQAQTTGLFAQLPMKCYTGRQIRINAKHTQREGIQS